MAEKVEIEITADVSDFIADAKKIQDEMDKLDAQLKEAGVSQSAYNQAVKNSSAAMQENNSVAKESAFSFTELRSAYSVVMDVMREGEKVYQETVGFAQEYDQVIKEIMVSSGGGAEATSRLVATLGDMGIEVGTVKIALKEMGKDGTAPTIDAMAKLSDAFLALAPGADRTQFLLDKFGKSGLDMARAMEMGGDKIRAMSQAVDTNLIVTDKAIQQSEEYRANLNDLQDTWDGIKVEVGNAVIPVLNNLFSQMGKNITSVSEASGVFEKLTAILKGGVNEWRALLGIQNDAVSKVDSATQSYMAMAQSQEQIAGATNGAGSEFEKEAEKVKQAEEAMKAMTQANSDMLSLTMSIAQETKNYNESLAKQIAEQQDVSAQIQDATTKYGAQSSQVAALKDKYDKLGGSIDELKKKHADAMAKIQYDLILTKLKADGFTDAEYKMALAAGVALGQIDQASADTADAMNQITNAALASGVSMDTLGAQMNNALSDGIINANELQTILNNLKIPPLVWTPISPGENLTGPVDWINCFIENTLILMANGSYKPIQDVKIGDGVISYNIEKDIQIIATVGQVFIHPDTPEYLLINDIGVTSNHPMYVNREWKDAGDIINGDSLLTRYGTAQEVVTIKTVKKTVTTYNLEINDDNHNYYAGGVLVHNKAGGGWANGPGNGSVDTIPTMLANGEYVVKSSAARKNAGLLEAINSGQDISGIGTGTVINNYGPVTQVFDGVGGDLIGVR